jgi:DNA-binding response OmpR family regulator
MNAPSTQHKVFFIEDDAHLSRMYERVFHLNQYEVVISADGNDALATLATMERLPDAIVLDAMLPSMSGQDVLIEIKADPRLANIPVVVLTNTLHADWGQKFRAIGADDFLIKMDTSTDEIVRVVSELVDKQSRLTPALQ